MCVFNNTFEETSDQRPTSSIHRFHSGGALFLTEGLGGDAGRSSAARSVARCFSYSSRRVKPPSCARPPSITRAHKPSDRSGVNVSSGRRQLLECYRL